MTKRRKVITYSRVFFGVLFIAVLILLTPWLLYQKATIYGISNAFIKLEKLPPPFYSPTKFKFEKVENTHFDYKKAWKPFHFFDYKVDFPVRHPLYLVVPILNWQYKGSTKWGLGYKLVNSNREEIAAVNFSRPKALALKFKKNKIFQLPIFKSAIMARGEEKLWIDLFTLNIDQVGILELKDWMKANHKMVENLFILHNRDEFLPANAAKINYWEERQLGIVELQDYEVRIGLVDRYQEEIIYIARNEKIHTIKIKILKGNRSAEIFRRKFLSSLQYFESTPESSSNIYKNYKKLSYERKTDQEGMIYLLSAWTHSFDNKKYLQEMLFYLDRDKSNFVHTLPLYQYAYKLWGNDFKSFTESISNAKKAAGKLNPRQEELSEDIDLKNSTMEEN